MVLVDFNAMCGILSTRMNDGFFVFFRLELECLFGTAQHMTAFNILIINYYMLLHVVLLRQLVI